MLRRTLSVPFLVLALCATLASLARADDTLQLFKKYFHTYKTTPSRVEAVLTLDGVEETGAVDLLLPILKDPDTQVAAAVVKVFSGYKTRPPVDAMLAALKSSKDEAVRIGILRAIAGGKYADVTSAIAPVLSEKSWELKHFAIDAAMAVNDASVADKLAPLCDDPEPAVRETALTALTAFKSPLVVPKACNLLRDSVWQVRTCAIAALTKVRSADAVGPLIDRLVIEEGRLVPEIAEALANLTGKEIGADSDKWKKWWAENKDKFVLPTEEAIAYLRGKHDTHTGGARPEFMKSGVKPYHSIQTPSRSMTFVIDVSGSMESEVVEKERFSDGNYPSLTRIEIVKTELSREIDSLADYVNFNILAFATKINPWKKSLQKATILNKSAAKEWIKTLVAIGGASKEDLVQVGFTSTGNLEGGKTNTYEALMTALNVKNPKTADKDYQVDVDTVFFLSDGRPTVGEFVDPDDILRELKSVNELRKVVIHTIAIGEFQKDFMRRIAEQNGGQFVDLGR